MAAPELGAQVSPFAEIVGSIPLSQRIAAGAAIAVIVLGSIATFGWAIRDPRLIQILPDLPPMTRNTAACFILGGVALLTLALGGVRWLVAVSAGLVAILGAITLVEITFKVSTGINEILGPSTINTGLTRRGGMAPGTAISFTVGSVALLCAPYLPKYRAAQLVGLLGSIVAAFGVAATIGFYGGVALAALHTAVGFCFFGFGMMALGWRVDANPTPSWLPISVFVGLIAGLLGLWRGLIVGGYEPFSLLPLGVLVAGAIVAPTFALTVYLAQRGFAQASALRQSEAALASSERKAQLIVDSIPGLVAVFSAKGELELVNQQTIEYFGRSLEDQKDWETSGEMNHPEDRPRVVEIFNRSIQSGEPFYIEVRGRRADGSYRWLESRGLPLRDASGRIVNWYNLMVDIDDRKRAEDSVAANERNLQQTIDTIPAFAWSATPDGMADFINQHYQDFVGLPPEQLLGTGWTSCLHPDDVPALLAKWQEMMMTGLGGEAEARMRRHDGQYRWLMFRTNPLRDANGNIVKWYGVNSDIEDRKRAVDELSQSEALLNHGQQASHTGSAVWNLRTDAFMLSAEAYRIYEFEPGTVVTNEMLASRTHPEDVHILEEQLEEVRNGIGHLDFNIRLLMPDGRIKSLRTISQLARHPERGDEFLSVMQDVTEQKRAEEELAASESSLQQTIDTIPALAWSARPDGLADFINQHYLDFVGLPPEQLLGAGWASCVHPDDLPGLLTTWQGMMETGQGGEAEARMRRHDGSYRWLRFHTNPLKDDHGRVLKWYGINTDTEDRKRAEASLAREKQLLEMIASGGNLREVLTELCRFVEEDAVDLLCDVHPIDWNTKTFRYGTSPTLPESYTAPIAGLAVEDGLLPCAVAAHERVQIIAEDLETDPRWQTSHVREHALKYGLRAVWSTPIISTTGTVLGTLCIYQRKPAQPTEEHQSLIAHATHIASIAIERLQTEEELRRSYDRLAAAQKLSKTGNFTADVVVDNHIWSAELYRIFEFDPDINISVQHVRDVIHPDDLPAFDAGFQRSAAERKPFDQVFRIVTRSGVLKYVHALAEVAEMTAGRPVFSGAIRDVTVEREAEEALNRTRSELAHVARVTALSTLSASIAHEVSQPLSGIVTNASTGLRMLAADPPNIEGARETARRTIRDGNRASEVVTRLRAMFGNRKPVADRVNLNDATRDVIALSTGELQRKRIELVFEPAPDLAPVSGDRVQLQQVILNLLLNASDALGGVEKGSLRRITIKTDMVEADQVRLTVKDTGVGIGPEAATRLFDAFYTTKDAGMGIGLSVSRSIIEHHRGRIWASPNEGPGASFSFVLPRIEGVPLARDPADEPRDDSKGVL